MEKDKLHDSHQDNDGIREYDNPLPAWFVNLFYGCIAYSVLYVGFYTGQGWALSRAGGTSQSLSWSGAEYLAAVHREEKAEVRPAELTGEALQEYLREPGSISQGEAVYKANCLACHGDQGQGVVGPNLVDAFWIHGGKAESVLASIATGYPDKGMPAWKPVLGSEKVKLATAYVLSIRGRTVANPKAPQGVREP